MNVVVTVPGLILVNPLNGSWGHWSTKSKRRREQKTLTRLYLSQLGARTREALAAAPALRVRFVRVGGRKMDSDGLVAALKAPRDAVAEWLGVDDGSDWYVWEWPGQEAGAVGVRIEMTTGEGEA